MLYSDLTLTTEKSNKGSGQIGITCISFSPTFFSSGKPQDYENIFFWNKGRKFGEGEEVPLLLALFTPSDHEMLYLIGFVLRVINSKYA